MSLLCVEWLCTHGRWKPEVDIIFGAAARFRRTAAGSTHDAHQDNSTLHTEAARPHTGFVGRYKKKEQKRPTCSLILN